MGSFLQSAGNLFNMNVDVVIGFMESIPVDWMLIGAFMVFSAFDVLRNGVGRLSALSLAVPASLLVVSFFPQAVFLGSFAEQLATPLLQAMVFLIFSAALYLLVRRMDSPYRGEYGQPLQALLAGCAGAAILLVVWFHVPALASLWQFGGDVTAVFSGPYAFWWLLGSYATLAFIRS